MNYKAGLFSFRVSKFRTITGGLRNRSEVGCVAVRWYIGFEYLRVATHPTAFNQAQCCIRSFSSPRNVAVFRPMALNAVNQETTLKRSLRQKRLGAAMNDDYMMKILQPLCQA